MKTIDSALDPFYFDANPDLINTLLKKWIRIQVMNIFLKFTDFQFWISFFSILRRHLLNHLKGFLQSFSVNSFLCF